MYCNLRRVYKSQAGIPGGCYHNMILPRSMECPRAQPVQAYLSTHLRFYASALGKENFFIVGEVNQAPEYNVKRFIAGMEIEDKKQQWKVPQK